MELCRYTLERHLSRSFWRLGYRDKRCWRNETPAEKAYHRALEKLTRKLVKAGVLHAVELRKKKNANPIYEYRVDYDGEWGEILFDFDSGTAKIVRLADWDTVKTNKFANAAIQHILSLPLDALTKNMGIPIEK